MRYITYSLTFLFAVIGVLAFPKETQNSNKDDMTHKADMTVTVSNTDTLPSAKISNDWGSGYEVSPGPSTDGSRPFTPSTANVGGVYSCIDINYGGRCLYKVYPLRFCSILPSWSRTVVSSIGPDQGTRVIGFSNEDCSGPSITVLYPGTSNLHGYGWGDRIGSIVALR
ncbi:hypothetical protein M422DRAFT_250721 [Sphaerobolus stellatus SS14]|uniref:Uncharacterized protein n=1 Tax=Sphaerobolus stellatus (strain SS14) TaxID=990650 RepID=A0A0C9VTN5_SPHS4|nr:hypothetical protein M422DRAFT_250721 [Sphaerobolus stellatus SS14]